MLKPNFITPLMPPPNGTVHMLPLEGFQLAVRMGCAKALRKRRGGPDSGRVLASKPEVIEHAWFAGKSET